MLKRSAADVRAMSPDRSIVPGRLAFRDRNNENDTTDPESNILLQTIVVVQPFCGRTQSA